MLLIIPPGYRDVVRPDEVEVFRWYLWRRKARVKISWVITGASEVPSLPRLACEQGSIAVLWCLVTQKCATEFFYLRLLVDEVLQPE